MGFTVCSDIGTTARSTFPHLVVDIEGLGQLDVWATSERHIGIATVGNLNVERADGEAQKYVTVNRVDLTLRMDYTRTAETDRKYVTQIVDGTDDWSYEYNTLSLNRVDRYESASSAARAKVHKILDEFLAAFVDSYAGRALLDMAGRASRVSKVEGIKAQLDKLQAQRDELLRELGELERAEGVVAS